MQSVLQESQCQSCPYRTSRRSVLFLQNLSAFLEVFRRLIKYIYEIGCKGSKKKADVQIKKAKSVFCGAFAHRVSVVEFVLDVFLGGDESRFREFLVVARNFDLFAVFGYFFEVIVERSELLEFLFEVVAHSAGDLVGTFCDDANGFVDVAGGLGEFHQVSSYGVERSVRFLVVHLPL